MVTKLGFKAVLVGVLGGAVLSGCSAQVPADGIASESRPSAIAAALLNASALSSADYDPVETTDELAEISEIVVKGRVADVQVGPVVGYLDDELSDIPTVMITIDNVEVEEGELPPESDGKVYVPLIAPGQPEEFGKLIPIGSLVVFYGNQIAQVADKGATPINFFDAGRPAGQPMYGLANPQALVLDVSSDDSGELVWPDANAWAESPIDETLPGGDEVAIEPSHE
ncbi:hypothetical protein [Cryobacterium zongtaii]|uniref:hypothetical protein n=1 Tax=Cryobacterium zongtaii TaxID=1259217 RepID=UPI001057499A|nr:hypothetical protein [Cryobacterium zongtaii]